MPELSFNPVIHAVDDDRRFLSTLERTLRSTGLTVIAHSRAHDLLQALNPRQPGCVVTDLRMPQMDGLELQRQINGRGIRLPLIFITGHGDAHDAVTALKNGAVDFLEKPFSEQALLDSVRLALDKDAVDRRLAEEQAVVRERYVRLSPREQQVFALVVSDLPNKTIAQQLKISPRTVEHHRQHLMLKMHADSQAELITMAVLCGIHELHLRS